MTHPADVGTLSECHVCFALTIADKELSHVEKAHFLHFAEKKESCMGCLTLQGESTK